MQTTDSCHQLPVAPNLLAQDFKAARPDQVWTADITYVATAEGWLYVAAIKDLFAGEVVWRSFGARMTIGARMTTDFVVTVRAFADGSVGKAFVEGDARSNRLVARC
jgi:transposase InsO family protein